MLKRLLQVVACALFIGVLAPTARPVELPTPFTIQGEWWCSEGGATSVVKLDIQPIAGGVAQVIGGGVSRPFEQAFKIDTEVDQFLRFSSTRSLSGTINLVSMSEDESIGTLTITSGALNNTKTILKLRGTLALNGRPSRNVKYKCMRVPSSIPDWEGRSTDSRMRGRTLKSDKFDVQLTINEDLGFPCFDLLSLGPVKINGVESPDVLMLGTVAVNSRGQIAAQLTSEMLGNGVGSGKLRARDNDRPLLKLKLSTDQHPKGSVKLELLQLINR